MLPSKTPSLRLGEEDLKCKNGCGYYGNPHWEGYCSKCHKDLLQRQENLTKRSTSFRSVSPSRRRGRFEQSKSESLSGFNKFQEKKAKQVSDKKPSGTLRKISSLITKPSNSTRRLDFFPDSHIDKAELDKIDQEYEGCFGDIRDAIFNDVRKQIKNLTSTILTADDKSVDELGEIVQNSYKVLAKRMEASPIYVETNQEEKELLLDYFEKYSMTYLYRLLFCHPSTKDEEEDLAIQNRIRQLNWVSAKHLDCAIDETNAEVRDLVYNAITDLLGLDSAKAPQDKLTCVVNSSRKIFLLLQQSVGGPASADEFLPALIFIVLKANPTRFWSNVNYMSKFSNASRLMSGESGYYYTNLCCALEFIQKLTAANLSMAEEEFEQYMSGSVVLPNTWESALIMLESMHLMDEHFAILEDLRNKHDGLIKDSGTLQEEMFKFQEDVTVKVSAVLARTPLQLKPRKSPTNIDSEDPKINQLPPPIIPEVVPTAVTPVKVKKERSTAECNLFAETLKLSKGMDLSMSESKSLDEIHSDALKSINYDIDLSDLSAENSRADDEPGMTHSLSQYLEESDRSQGSSFKLSFKPENSSLLDSSGSPTASMWLPSPLKPTQSMFSANTWDIPSIPCNTGEFNSLQSISDQAQNDKPASLDRNGSSLI